MFLATLVGVGLMVISAVTSLIALWIGASQVPRLSLSLQYRGSQELTEHLIPPNGLTQGVDQTPDLPASGHLQPASAVIGLFHGS